MNDGVRRIRRDIARLKQDRRPTAVRYPVAIQRKVIALARRRQVGGAGIAALARELGLAEWTVSLWLRKTPVPILRAVEIGSAPPPAPPVAAPVLITRRAFGSKARPSRRSRCCSARCGDRVHAPGHRVGVRCFGRSAQRLRRAQRPREPAARPGSAVGGLLSVRQCHAQTREGPPVGWHRAVHLREAARARGRFACLWHDADARVVRLTMSELQRFLEGSTLVGRVALSPAPFVVGAEQKKVVRIRRR